MRGKPHPPEIKAAVIAALMAGQGVTEVAEEYSLDHSIVSRWAKTLGGLHEVARKKNFDELVSNYLEELLVTLSVQARIFREPSWVKQQDAADLAMLHGVMADKGFRILSAAQPVEPAGAEPVEAPGRPSDGGVEE